MFSDNIIIRGVLMQTVIVICCIIALSLEYFALESDFTWNTHLQHAVVREDEREEKFSATNSNSAFKRLYGDRDTEYLLMRNLQFERCVSVFLIVYLIFSIVYLISCLLNKTVGLSRRCYEAFFTASFFLLLVTMGMQFLSLHTYDVNYTQWEIRNGRSVSHFNGQTQETETFLVKLHHPCTSDSILELPEKDRLKSEAEFGPNACQFYNTKLSVLILLTISWMFSLLIVLSIADCSYSNKIIPDYTPEDAIRPESKGKYPKKDEHCQVEDECYVSCSSNGNSSNSSAISASDNGNVCAERILAKFRSELEVINN